MTYVRDFVSAFTSMGMQWTLPRLRLTLRQTGKPHRTCVLHWGTRPLKVQSRLPSPRYGRVLICSSLDCSSSILGAKRVHWSLWIPSKNVNRGRYFGACYGLQGGQLCLPFGRGPDPEMGAACMTRLRFTCWEAPSAWETLVTGAAQSGRSEPSPGRGEVGPA